ncbi:hypothetical protein EMO55_03865 [Escherichia coli]|nr:hypothetical protein [Escherichia coli]MGQ71227.1 hypothetical protein [Escherichia coli]
MPSGRVTSGFSRNAAGREILPSGKTASRKVLKSLKYHENTHAQHKNRTENREEKLQKISLNEILHLRESPELAHPARHFFTPEN